jgi:hypothetical protein
MISGVSKVVLPVATIRTALATRWDSATEPVGGAR